MSDEAGYFAHSHALCESDAVGPRTRVWAFAHILPGASIGADCNVCDHAFIESQVVIGDRVTVKNRVLIFDGVTVEDDVFLGPAVVFTNDLRPRAEIKKSGAALTRTLVRRGATLGAGVVVVAGHTVGEYSFTGAGAVIVSDLAPHGFYVGNPAHRRGWVCRCGDRLEADLRCQCGRRYRRVDQEADMAGLEEVRDGG